VRPIHAKAMPVVLSTTEEFDTWLEGSVDDAIALQKPLASELLRIVALERYRDAVAAFIMTI
jgi:putative SOS response-associated peptidase YedK